jgi:ubiquinone/menaquinone biosynthesis C-methylase UbiE
MKIPESVPPDTTNQLTTKIKDFWTRRVNAEFIMGNAVTTHPRGDDLYFRDLEEQRYRSHRHLLPWIQAMHPGKTVLEIGCGVGLDTYTMAIHGLQVTAVDLTYIALHTAQQRFFRQNVPANFVLTDACNMPFPSNTFDYVYSFGVLHHVADTEKSIAEVLRLIKPGGQARIMLYHRHSLNELVHRVLHVPFEDRDEICPVVRRFTVTEAYRLFRNFRETKINIEYIYGEGYGHLFSLTPRRLYDFLSKRWGWHLMIVATK